MKSPKEVALDTKLLGMLSGRAREAAELMLEDPEIRYLQEYSNTVSIKRLGYNDHGPVHMRKVLMNALVMCDLLTQTGITLNLEQEGLERPIMITVAMSASVGIFQIEEVLFTKVNASPIKPHIELYADIAGSELKRYL